MGSNCYIVALLRQMSSDSHADIYTDLEHPGNTEYAAIQPSVGLVESCYSPVPMPMPMPIPMLI